MTGPGTPLLEIENLRMWFHGEEGISRAVDGVSLRVDDGETVALVGESGCGKSMTAHSVLRLVPEPPGRILPDSSVRLRGEELLTAPGERLRALRGSVVAMVFQEPAAALNPVLSIGVQISEAIRAHSRVGGRALRDRVLELLERVGMPEPSRQFDSYPHQLSGGMRQRAMIAMALSCDPSLLIADEPTTALDVTVQAQILELLRSLQEERGMAILLITHDLGVVAEVAERVAVMYAGQVVEEASVGDLFQAPSHPYTRALLRSRPELVSGGARLSAISGAVPRASRWPSGCRFHPRCSEAWERCSVDAPDLLVSGRGRARCWLLAEPEER